MAKRKRIDGPSSNERRMGERNGGVTPSKTLTQFDPAKRPKTGIFFQRDSAIVSVRADLPSLDSLLPSGAIHPLHCTRVWQLGEIRLGLLFARLHPSPHQ